MESFRGTIRYICILVPYSNVFTILFFNCTFSFWRVRGVSKRIVLLYGIIFWGGVQQQEFYCICLCVCVCEKKYYLSSE